MRVIIFSFDNKIIDTMEKKLLKYESIICFDIKTLKEEIKKENSIIIVDYDTLSKDINELFKNNEIPEKLIILESNPNITTGKNLIYKKIKAYGNLNMLQIHFDQMMKTVSNNNIWTYPELTIKLKDKKEIISKESEDLLSKRLTDKEIDIVYFILNGLNNEAISKEFDITIRTVKSYISSIFKKLHINDRLGLILLLK